MINKMVAGLQLYFEAGEQDDASVIESACDRSVRLIHWRWNLATPQDCRVYVMTAWLPFLLASAPAPWKAFIILSLPFLAIRARAIWRYSGGWSLSYGRRQVVGIKPARLIQTGDQSLGDRIFSRDRSIGETVQTVTCHELVHAFTSHLKLPAWLHEGLATLGMEYYLGRRIIREETIHLLRNNPNSRINPRERRARMDNPDVLLYQYARGYWLTRYLDETMPDLLKAWLARRQKPEELDAKIASAYGKDPESFWEGIHGEIFRHFEDGKDHLLASLSIPE